MSTDGPFVNSTNISFSALLQYIWHIILCYLRYFKAGMANYSCGQIQPVVYFCTTCNLKNGSHIFKGLLKKKASVGHKAYTFMGILNSSEQQSFNKMVFSYTCFSKIDFHCVHKTLVFWSTNIFFLNRK